MPVASLITFASTTGKLSLLKVIDGSTVDWPPLICRSISVTPRSNSWLPSVPTSMPIAFSASSVGLSRSRPDAGGLAPTMSPASTVTVSCGSVALAAFR